jgi:hypothetical protein
MGKSRACSGFLTRSGWLPCEHHGCPTNEVIIEAPALAVRDGLVVLTWLVAVHLVHSLLTLAQLSFKPVLGHVAETALLALVAPMASPVAADPSVKAGADRARPVVEPLPLPEGPLQLSPRYEVALSLAFQGFELIDIARRCDITVAEAKLVATLADSFQGLKTSAEERHGTGTRVAA